jgi:hypothetical protein
MLRQQITTKQIVMESRFAIQRYDEMCKQFWAEAGAAGINRRARFQQLLETIEKNQYTPVEALITVYDFVLNEDVTSRLRNTIRDGLYCLLGISFPQYESSIYRTASRIMEAEEQLHSVMKNIKSEAGFVADNDIMLKSMQSQSSQ